MQLTDRRVQRTQALLLDALIALAQERRYDEITIRDITERADVAYSTFFRHFPDKDALLLQSVRDVVATLTALMYPDSEQRPQIDGRLLFRHVQEHEAFYRIILSGHGTHHVLAQAMEQIETEFAVLYASFGESAIPVDLLTHHIIAAVLELVKWWLDHQQPYSVERMGQIFQTLIIDASETAAFGRPMRLHLQPEQQDSEFK